MALNKIRFLNENELLTLLNENGYEDIAKILRGRGINGQKFLELSELETRLWKLTLFQKKNLFSFAEQLKQDPSIIQTVKPVKPFPSRNTPTLNLPAKPYFNFNSNVKLPLEKFSPTKPEQNDFKHRLDSIFGGQVASNFPPNINFYPIKNTRSRSPLPLPSESNLPPFPPPNPPPLPPSNPQPKYHNSVPPIPTSMTLENLGKKTNPFILEPVDQNKVVNSTMQENQMKQYKNMRPAPPLPTDVQKMNPLVSEPAGRKTSSRITAPFNLTNPLEMTNRPALHVPIEPPRRNSSSNLKTKPSPLKTHEVVANTPIKFRPPLPIPDSPTEEMEPKFNMDTKYSVQYTNLIEEKPVLEYDYISAEDVDFDYANAAIIKLHSQGKAAMPKIERNPIEWPMEDLIISYVNIPYQHKIEDIASRPPLPYPKEISENCYQSLDNLKIKNDNKIEDIHNYNFEVWANMGEKNIEDDIDPKSGYLDIKDINIQRIDSNRHPVTQPKLKSSINDLQNVIIIDGEQSKRQNNVFGRILTKIAVKKVDKKVEKKAETKPPVLKHLNYENHMVEGTRVTIKNLPSCKKNCPLPSIPVSEIRTKQDFNVGMMSPVETPEFSSDEDSSSNTKKLYENITSGNDNFNNDKNEINNLSISLFETNKKKSHKPILNEDFAFQLSQELKNRNLKVNAPIGHDVETGIVDTEKHVFRNVNPVQPGYQKPQLSGYNLVKDHDAFAKRHHVSGDQHDLNSIFNTTNEKYYRNIDRKSANDLLRKLPDGAFVIRPSRQHFLVLAIKYRGKCYNLGIERTNNNKIRLNSDTSSILPEFRTLQEFVDYFTKEAVTFKDVDNVLVEIYLNPVLP